MTSRGAYRRHSTPFKLQLCQDIRAGTIRRRDAQRSHNISANLILLWPTQFDRGVVADEEDEASVIAEYETRIAALERNHALQFVFCEALDWPSTIIPTNRLKEKAMSRQGASQLLRRVIAALLFMAAAISIGIAPPVWVGALVVAGGAIYGVWPKPETKTGDLMLRNGPAVIGPDVLGFSLTALFAALPIWIGRGEATPGLHGSASMIWIMAVGSAVLLFVGASASCFRLRLGSDRVTLIKLRGESELCWPDIIGWKRWRRGLPGVLRKLALFLPPGPAGSVLLARDSTGLELHLLDGRIFRLPHEGFEHGEEQVLQARKAHGVRQLSGRATE